MTTDQAINCESSCPCYYSQIEGLGLHVVNITHYAITIGQLHDDVILLHLPEFLSLLFSCAN